MSKQASLRVWRSQVWQLRSDRKAWRLVFHTYLRPHLSCRLAGGKKNQPSIMVGNLAGSYYALPLMNEEQKSGLLAIMPPNATKIVEREAEKCEEEDCGQLPDEVRLITLSTATAFLHFCSHLEVIRPCTQSPLPVFAKTPKSSSFFFPLSQCRWTLQV